MRAKPEYGRLQGPKAVPFEIQRDQMEDENKQMAHEQSYLALEHANSGVTPNQRRHQAHPVALLAFQSEQWKTYGSESVRERKALGWKIRNRSTYETPACSWPVI